jgi:translation initiation factor 1
MGKKQTYTGGLIYSTEPTALRAEVQEEQETLPPNQQRLVVKLDTKHRAGKVVTVVDGFIGKDDDLNTLGKLLKTKCGAGGAVKDGLILIQGDFKKNIISLLQQLKYNVK